jgi:hypothetical protein
MKERALDWAASKCEGIEWEPGDLAAGHYGPGFAPTTNWADGGPIIERGLIVISPDSQHGWRANPYMDLTEFYGPTPLIAAMRCYVASVLGDEVDVPEELQ